MCKRSSYRTPSLWTRVSRPPSASTLDTSSKGAGIAMGERMPRQFDAFCRPATTGLYPFEKVEKWCL